MKKKQLIFFLVFIVFLSVKPLVSFTQAAILTAADGKVSFISEAPLETIKAGSNKLKAVIDRTNNTFAFAVPIMSFQGFNNDLQREHFHENYMETDKLPEATFTGKLIEQVDFSTPGTYTVRAKGIFTIHGIPQEKIIKGTIVISNSRVDLNADFNIRLEDFNIKVPKIVYEKIAEEIKINVAVNFKK